MPSLPGGVTPPIAVLPSPPVEGGSREINASAAVGMVNPTTTIPCPGGRVDASANGDPALMAGCRSIAAEDDANAPITAGRDLVEDTLWNAWADSHYTYTSDERHGLSNTGHGGVVVVGADRRVASGLVGGLQLTMETSSNRGFDGDVASDSNGFMVSPYLAYQASPQWSLYGAIGFGQTSTDSRILFLNGSFDVQRYTLTLNAQGQYPLGEAFVRPKFTLSYAHNSADAYDMQGQAFVFGMPLSLSLRMPKNSYNFGSIDSALEINRVYRFADGSAVMPYAEVGITYDFERPNSGRYLDGNLDYQEASRWAGMARLGARTLVDKATMVEFAAGYLSVGTNDLAVWDLRLFLSHSF
jgi:outer membrane autotransporter protein